LLTNTSEKPIYIYIYKGSHQLFGLPCETVLLDEEGRLLLRARYEAGNYNLIEYHAFIYCLTKTKESPLVLHGSLTSRESAHDSKMQDRRNRWNVPRMRLFKYRRALARNLQPLSTAYGF